MASLLALPHFSQTDDLLLGNGLLLGHGVTPAEALAPVFSSLFRESLVVSASDSAMTSAAVQTLYHALCEPTPAPAHFILPMFTEPTALSAPWPLPTALDFSGGAPHVERFDLIDDQHLLSILASDMVVSLQEFAHLCVMTSIESPRTSTPPPADASRKRRIDIDDYDIDDYDRPSQFATMAKKQAHGVCLSQLNDEDLAVCSAMPPSNSASDMAQLASDWHSILLGVCGICEEAALSFPAKADHEEHGEDPWYFFNPYQLGMSPTAGC
ncbi:hypothetical protein T492DRAFT_844264 [Pavlovales sp. CCMP2436]|nr:hypothetical protein T492DRAFT_844264 [Pavlovales sp. CCMP2436]